MSGLAALAVVGIGAVLIMRRKGGSEVGPALGRGLARFAIAVPYPEQAGRADCTAWCCII